MAARSVLAVLTVLACALSFAPSGHADETAGVTCSPAVPFDLGYADALPGPLAIPDNTPAGVYNCMEIPAAEAQTISDLDVAMTIDHTWVGDLVVTLTHIETGRSVVLLDRPGLPAVSFGCGGDNVRATFSDEAALPAEDECSPTPPAIYGVLRPTQLLSAFDGEAIAGKWVINVSDNSNQDVGTLNSWTLLPTYEFPGANGDVNCSGDADAVDAALILQISAGFNFTLQCPENGDVNASGMMDAIDAALVLQYSAGLLPFLPLPPPPI